jgi:hypothetical protein
MSGDRKTSPARRRYQQRFWPLMGLYMVLIFGVALLIKHAPPPGAWRYLAAVAPAVPIIGIIAVFGLYLGELTDEFRRMVIVRSMLWSLGFVLAFSTVWGFLEMLADAPHLQLWWVFPIYAVGQGLAEHLIRRRYA